MTTGPMLMTDQLIHHTEFKEKQEKLGGTNMRTGTQFNLIFRPGNDNKNLIAYQNNKICQGAVLYVVYLKQKTLQ